MGKSIKYCVCALFVSVSLISCNKEDDVKTRTFNMGFTPFPYEVSLNAVNYTYDLLDTDADIINHHFDNGVPWNEALNDQPFHQAIMDDWNFRKANTNANHKVYVSVTPLNALRTGLASYRAEEDNMTLPSPWSTYPFNHVNVRTAYFNYCKRAIEFFDPEYFNMAIEANLFYVNSPGRWSEYMQLHEYVYSQLKLNYPNLKIFTSVVGAHLLPEFIAGNDHVQQRLAVLQLMEYSDLYGISFYPYMSAFLGNPYPETAFDALFAITPKPIVVAETGYPAQAFSFNPGSGVISIQSDPSKQQRFVGDLLAACDRWKAQFVIIYAIRDYDQMWEQLGSPNDLFVAWRDTGLYDESGTARPALKIWKQYLGRKYQAPSN